MTIPLLATAAALLVLVGGAHSYLGEKYILSRLFRRDNIPHLLGSDVFTKQVLRFAWHLTTVAWWTFAAILVSIATAPLGVEIRWTLWALAAGTAMTGLTIFAATRGRHLAWIVFAASAVCIFIATD